MKKKNSMFIISGSTHSKDPIFGIHMGILNQLSTEWRNSSVGAWAGNYMFKVNNRNTRTRCGICSKLTIKIPERCLEQVNTSWEETQWIFQWILQNFSKHQNHLFLYKFSRLVLLFPLILYLMLVIEIMAIHIFVEKRITLDV